MPVLAAPALAQAITPAEATRIDTAVRQVLARTGVPSAQVAVVRGGRLVYAHSWGKASETIPVARDDLPYQVASNSKQFTAAAVLLLQRDGKLRLDDHVSQYLPGITGGDRMTIRQLLSHTSGLQDYWPQDYAFPAMRTPVSPQGIVDRWARKPLDFEPGTQWQYSNTGYVVAGLIVEKVAGEPLLSFLQRRIFAPLDMHPIDQDAAVGPAFPQGYGRFALGPVRAEAPPARGWLFAAGELSMSATDMARWDIARLDRAILSPEEWATQETEVTLADGKPTHYGLGVGIGTFDGQRAIAHSGEAVGFLSANTVYPDAKAAVTVLTNGDFSDAFEAIAKRVAAVILPPARAGAAMPTGDAGAAAQARRTFDQLRTGTLDRRIMTANSNSYFTPAALADYHASLLPLGTPTGFEQSGKTSLRGGFVTREYKVTYPGRTLSIVTYAELDGANGAPGRYEQFLVMPSE